jgi:hypothetical protein
MGFFEVIFGALVAIGTAIFVEYLRRPNLYLEIISPDDQAHPPDKPATNIRALRVMLYNRALPCWARWMLRVPALQCRAAITFHYHTDRKDIFGRAMEGRWADTPQPFPIVLAEGQFVLTPEYRGIDVMPGDSAILDIAIRADDEVDAYGWNNESFSCKPLWRNPDWKLPPGRYLVKVAITSSGQKSISWFHLENTTSRRGFRLDLPKSQH